MKKKNSGASAAAAAAAAPTSDQAHSSQWRRGKEVVRAPECCRFLRRARMRLHRTMSTRW